MTLYNGNIAEDQTIDFTFNTTDSADVPITLAGSPAISVYKGNNTIQTTTGVTLTVDFDGLTGLHQVRIVTTDAFYVVDENYSAVITTGTIGGATAIGKITGEFSIEARIADSSELDMYTDGFVYYDAAAGNTNTALRTDGTPDNPVSSKAAAKTLADQVGFKIRIKGNLTDDSGLANYELENWDGTGRYTGVTAPSIAGSVLRGLTVTGLGIMSNDTKFENCDLESITGAASAGLKGKLFDCTFKGTIALDDAASSVTTIINGANRNASGVITFDFQQANNRNRFEIFGYLGSITISNMNGANNRYNSFTDAGFNVIFDASNTTGTPQLTGAGRIVDSSTGAFNIIRSTFQDVPFQPTLDAIQLSSNISKYFGGYVYYDAGAANLNTFLGTDGTIDKPVSGTAEAITLADQVGKKIKYKGSLAMTQSFAGIVLEAWNGTGNLTGNSAMDLSDAIITGGSITTNFKGSILSELFSVAIISVTKFSTFGLIGTFNDCELIGTNQIDATAGVILVRNFSNGGTIDFDSAVGTVQIVDLGGTLNIINMKASSLLKVSGSAQGHITFGAGNTGGTATFNGSGSITGAGSGVVINIDDWEELPLGPAIAVIDTVVDAIKVDTTQILTDVGNLNDISAADVLTQVNIAFDASSTEISSVPAVTASLRLMQQWMFSIGRNKIVETATAQTIFKDDGTTTLGTRIMSDDGVNFTSGEAT